jgi:hypothetical protein
VSKTQVEEIKEKIQLAIQAVADVEEPFKTKAFEVILSALLKKPKVIIKGATTLDQKIAEFANEANVEVSKLDDIFEFGEDKPIFIGRVEGSEIEKQVQISRCLLAAYESVYGKDWVGSSILWKALDDYGVGALANLAKNLGKYEDEFRAKGQRRGRQYKLTQQGRKNALDLIRQLST